MEVKRQLPPSLGVQEAARLGVCRICRGHQSSFANPMLTKLGREHIHRRCAAMEMASKRSAATDEEGTDK